MALAVRAALAVAAATRVFDFNIYFPIGRVTGGTPVLWATFIRALGSGRVQGVGFCERRSQKGGDGGFGERKEINK